MSYMKYAVYGLGNALVDKEFEVSDEFLAQNGIEKGFMTLIDEPRQHELLANLQQTFGLKKRTGAALAPIVLLPSVNSAVKPFMPAKWLRMKRASFMPLI